MEAVQRWLAAAEPRYLADLTSAELVTRSLKALSTCYVERRAGLNRGSALSGAGKRAAFALFYAPLHFLTVREVARALVGEPGQRTISSRQVLDLGCGTGAAGAAWALTASGPRRGLRRQSVGSRRKRPGPIGRLGVEGHGPPISTRPCAMRGGALADLAGGVPGQRVSPPTRGRRSFHACVDAVRNGHRVVVIEPISASRRRRGGASGERAFETVRRGSAAEWRFGWRCHRLVAGSGPGSGPGSPRADGAAR